MTFVEHEQEDKGRPRRAELLAATSLAIDLGLGQPMEHMLRSCVLGMCLAHKLDLPTEQCDRIFYATLLCWIGCHADSHELAALFGDDIEFRAGTYQVDKHGLPLARFVLGRLAGEQPIWTRGARAAAFTATGGKPLKELIRSHCASASVLALRMGLDQAVAEQLGYAFERWDGAGVPNGARHDEIPLEMRIVHLADTADVFLHGPGPDTGPAAAIRMVRDRRGTQFDPEIADAFCDCAEDLATAASDDPWAAALEHAPDDRVLGESEFEAVLTAMGDFADLKSPYTAGHSRAVARLADAAGAGTGLDEPHRRLLRHAGLLHDLGRMGVSNSVWDKADPLTFAEQERVRLHPYFTERILSQVPALRDIARLAAAHHERLDGSGYSRGTSAEGLGLAERVLAAADSYCSWREPRPHRAALTATQAATRLRDQVTDMRLDAAAVDAVLRAAGHPVGRRGTWPAGLTGREIEVLRLIVRGLSSQQIARELVISPKTARNHVEHIYLKLGVTNRVGASLFAVQHGVVGLAEAGADGT